MTSRYHVSSIALSRSNPGLGVALDGPLALTHRMQPTSAHRRGDPGGGPCRCRHPVRDHGIGHFLVWSRITLGLSPRRRNW